MDGACASRPRSLRSTTSPGSVSPTPFTPSTRAGRRRVRHPSRARRHAAEELRTGHRVALDRPAGNSQRAARSRSIGDLRRRSSGFRWPDRRIPRQVDRGRSLALGCDPPYLRRPPAPLWRRQSVEAPGPATGGVLATGGCDGGAARVAPQAVRQRAGGAGEDSAQRRPREHRRHCRAVRARERPVA